MSGSKPEGDDKLFGRLKLRPSSQRRKTDHRLLSAEQLQRVLERERLRSDRNHATFSLLTFTFLERAEPGRDAGRSLEKVISILDRRLRATDEPGLLDKSCIGVVLPDTTAQGAWKLASDVCAELPANVAQPTCNVYEYPTREVLPKQEERSRATKHPVATPHIHYMERFYVRPIPVWKRSMDIFGSSVALLVFSPALLAIAALIKLTSKGPVIFSQRREGLGGVPFTIYKFRTMHVDAESKKAELRERSEQDGPAFKLTQDPRCTWFGTILRKTSLDELPQLFNVLKGDMSLVGPRPLPVDESLACERWQRRRLTVTPGITCIWQTEGRSSVPFTVWMRMDLAYSRERSFWCDTAILLRTLPAVLRGKGAH